ncbi:MAG: hypothetical protein M3R30_01435, partial [Candidatus Eremiobacteraeota bacterium]|nr:hypothetical protein [Candidatus Eremiobacteraeota bacterium]
MNAPYRTVAAATLVYILLASPATAKDKYQHRTVGAAPPPVGLYSPRALKRVRTILEMRLMELRAARLECVRETLERVLFGTTSEIWHCAKQSQALKD